VSFKCKRLIRHRFNRNVDTIVRYGQFKRLTVRTIFVPPDYFIACETRGELIFPPNGHSYHSQSRLKHYGKQFIFNPFADTALDFVDVKRTAVRPYQRIVDDFKLHFTDVEWIFTASQPFVEILLINTAR